MRMAADEKSDPSRLGLYEEEDFSQGDEAPKCSHPGSNDHAKVARLSG